MSKLDEPESADSPKPPPSLWRVFVIVAIAAGGVLCIYGCSVYAQLPNWEQRGQFGDSFGAANALFSGIAIAGVICALIFQHRDLHYQRAELIRTRTEMEAQTNLLRQSLLELKIALELSIDPVFVGISQFSRNQDGNLNGIRFENRGAHVKGVQISCREPIGLLARHENIDSLDKGGSARFWITGLPSGPRPNLKIRIQFRDQLENERYHEYRILPGKHELVRCDRHP